MTEPSDTSVDRMAQPNYNSADPRADSHVEETAMTRGSTIFTGNHSVLTRMENVDSDLVRLARAGDLSAYGALVEKHKRAVYGIVSRMVSSYDDVDDLVQDTFVQAYRSIGSFRGQSAFNTWLHSIAVNTTIKYLRKMKSRQALSIDDPEGGIERTLVSGERGAPDIAEDEERKAAVRKAVEQLSEKHRVVVALHYFDDYSCEEIAKILNCSVGTVWSRLHYACKKLRGQLDWLETA